MIKVISKEVIWSILLNYLSALYKVAPNLRLAVCAPCKYIGFHQRFCVFNTWQQGWSCFMIIRECQWTRNGIHKEMLVTSILHVNGRIVSKLYMHDIITWNQIFNKIVTLLPLLSVCFRHFIRQHIHYVYVHCLHSELLYKLLYKLFTEHSFFKVVYCD